MKKKFIYYPRNIRLQSQKQEFVHHVSTIFLLDRGGIYLEKTYILKKCWSKVKTKLDLIYLLHVYQEVNAVYNSKPITIKCS